MIPEQRADTAQDYRARLIQQVALLTHDLPAPTDIFIIGPEHLSLHLDSLAAVTAWAQYLGTEAKAPYQDRDGGWRCNVIGYLGKVLVSLAGTATGGEAEALTAARRLDAVVRGGAS